MEDTYWKYGVAFLAGLLIGVGGTWLYYDRAQDEDVMESVDDSEAGESVLDEDVFGGGLGTGVVQAKDNWIVVDDQFPGDTVQLKTVSLSVSGWVAIYEDNEGALGNILGARRFDAGEHSGTVSLLRSTAEGSLYYAIVHGDNGDKEFNLEDDPVLIDKNGKRVGTQFQTPPHRN